MAVLTGLRGVDCCRQGLVAVEGCRGPVVVMPCSIRAPPGRAGGLPMATAVPASSSSPALGREPVGRYLRGDRRRPGERRAGLGPAASTPQRAGLETATLLVLLGAAAGGLCTRPVRLCLRAGGAGFLGWFVSPQLAGRWWCSGPLSARSWSSIRYAAALPRAHAAFPGRRILGVPLGSWCCAISTRCSLRRRRALLSLYCPVMLFSANCRGSPPAASSADAHRVPTARSPIGRACRRGGDRGSSRENTSTGQ